MNDYQKALVATFTEWNLEAAKKFIANHYTPEKRMYEGMALAILRGDDQQLEIEFHKVRRYLHILPARCNRDSEWWLYHAGVYNDVWYMGICWAKREDSDEDQV